MRKLFTSIAILLIKCVLFAQVPQGISYQAIAFSAGGGPVSNGNVGVKISILDNSASGTVVYSEVHTKTTNGQGLFNLNIGQGTPTQGSFANINWSANSKFLKVELDPAGGTNYTSVGTNQLMSVPYALYAENTNTINLPGATNTVSSKNGVVIVVYTNTHAYGFTSAVSGSPTWYDKQLSGTVLGAVATDSAIVVYTSTHAYAFTVTGTGSPTWYDKQLSGSSVKAIAASGRTIVVYTSTNAYAFTKNIGSPHWTDEQLSGTPIGATVAGNNRVVVYTNTHAYGFAFSGSGSPTWYDRQLSGNVIGASTAGNVIVVYTSTYAYGFTVPTTGSPGWYDKQLSGTPVGIVPKQ